MPALGRGLVGRVRRAADLICGAVGPLAVEHVGSPSVPGLGGRNVLDVAIPLAPDALPAVRQAMDGLGFQGSPCPHYLPLLVGRFASKGRSHPVLLYLVAEHSADITSA